MRKIFIGVILLVVIFSLSYHPAYSIDDRDRFGLQPPQAQLPQPQNPQPPQNQQPPRPMLPPIIPFPQVGISPTPSPQITAPPLMQTTINQPPFPSNTQPPIMQTNFQSSPAQAVLPNTNIPVELPQVPIIGNSLGKVINTGLEKDGLAWIEVKDEIFNETLKIKINPKSTPVIKKNTPKNYRDIKIGDTVNVIFNQENDNIAANFVSILTEEDLKAMEADLKSGSNVKTNDDAKTKDNPAPPVE